MLPPLRLSYILERLRFNTNVQVVRISTRLPVVFPEGLRREHVDAIGKHPPIWIVIHINHPKEVTREFIEAAGMLRAAKAVLISQTVLLRGVNDCPHILSALFEQLVRLGVKPYYLFQLDDAQGAQHFKARVRTGIKLMRELRMNLSGLCIPQLALDITHGLGKIPLEPPYLGRRKGTALVLRNLEGKTGIYRDDGRESHCNNCGFCRSARG